MPDRTLTVHIVGDADALRRSLRSASRETAVFNARITSTSRNLARGLGFGAAVTGVAALGLAIRDTISAAIDFESSFAGVRKTVDATEPQLLAIAEGFRAMSREIPVSVEELNRIGEAAGQLGVQRGAILDFTRTVADLGVTTNLASEEAADALARIANITGLPQDQFDNLGSTIVELGNKLAATEQEIVAFSLRLAGAGRQIGLSEADIAAFGGALASVGIEAEAGGTAFSRVFINLANNVATGGAKLEAFAKVAGVTAEQFSTLFRDDAAAAVTAFIRGLDRISDSGGNVFKTLADLGLGEIRVRDALLRASGASDLFTRSIETGRRAFQENTALTEEAAKRYDTAASRLQVFRNRVNDLQITLGNVLVPALEDVISPLSDWLEETENQERVQRELTRALSDGRAIIEGIADVMVPLAAATRDAADAVGGLRNAVRLLLAVLIARKITDVGLGLLGLGTDARKAAKGVTALRLALLRLGLIGAITIPIAVVVNRRQIEQAGTDIQRQVKGFLERAGVGGILGGGTTELPVGFKIANLVEIRNRLADIKGESDDWVKALDRIIAKWREIGNVAAAAQSRSVDVADKLAGLAPKPVPVKVRIKPEIEVDTDGAGGGGGGARRLAADIRNRIFDQGLARELNRVQDGTLPQQLAALESIERNIEAQIAKVRDVTRKLNLRDDLLDVRRQQADVRQQIADQFVESLQLGVDRAALTKSINDDLAALNRLEAAIRAQIRKGGDINALQRELITIEQQRADLIQQQRDERLEGLRSRVDRAAVTAQLNDDLAALNALEAGLKRQLSVARGNLELQRELADVRRQQADVRREQAQRTQFRRLGLTAEGEEPVPGVAGLRKRLGQLRERLKGTPLDTEKTRSQLRRIAKVLSGEFGAVGAEVRAAIEAMFDEIASGFDDAKKKGPITKGAVVNTDEILAGLGLTPEQLRAARGRLSRVTTTGAPATGRRGAPPADVRGLGGQSVGVQINGNVTVISDDPDEMQRKLQKKSRRKATQTTGPHAGNSTGTTR